MKLAFQDFCPEYLRGGVLVESQYEPLEEVLMTANAWIASRNVDVINVETVLVSALQLKKRTPRNPVVMVRGNLPTELLQIIRVWYRA